MSYIYIDPPTHPVDPKVTILCSTGIISWTPSASADYYILNMRCGKNQVLKDNGLMEQPTFLTIASVLEIAVRLLFMQ